MTNKISLKNKKYCWLAKETSKGWQVRFCVGNKESKLVGMYFRTIEDVYIVIGREDEREYGSVFSWMANNPSRSKEDKLIFKSLVETE